MKQTVAIAVMIVMGSLAAQAIPTLQLDIGGGTYVGGTEESTIANTDTFTLYALLNPDEDSLVSSTYRISAALTPQTSETAPVPSHGSITFAGITYEVAADMVWGVPPVDLLDGTTAIGSTLPTHAVYPTYFIEFDVVFDALKQSAPYNVQDNPGDPTTFPGSGLYYQDFLVSVVGLDDSYGLHFDLYQVVADTEVSHGHRSATTTDVTDIVEKAPFSHDAGTGTTRFPPGDPPTVPDGGATLGLMGLAVVGMAGLRRRLAMRG